MLRRDKYPLELIEAACKSLALAGLKLFLITLGQKQIGLINTLSIWG